MIAFTKEFIYGQVKRLQAKLEKAKRRKHVWHPASEGPF